MHSEALSSGQAEPDANDKSIKDKLGDFVKPKFRNFGSFVVDHNEGLYGLLMGLIAFGLEEILNKEAFNCPSTNYEIYAISLFVAPGILLLILNLLTVPAQGKISVWTLCESCYIRDYRRFGDFCSGFLSALLVGCVAPIVWLITALFNERHLLCWELGFQLGDNVTEGYLKTRGFQYLEVDGYRQKVEHAKSKSHAAGAILLAASVLLLGIFVILRRSCQKPFEHEEKLPALWKLEKREALAASDWLERLMCTGSDGREVPNVFKNIMMSTLLSSMSTEVLDLKEDDARKKEIEMEVKEFQDLTKVWNAYCKFDGYGHTPHESETETKVEAARKVYEDERTRISESRKERVREAEKELAEISKAEPGEDRGKEMEDIKFNSWLVNRLKEQERYVDLVNFMGDWEPTDEERVYVRSLARSTVGEGFVDTPEETGRYVATCIMHQARKTGFFHANERALNHFKKIYPRAATCKPWHRYKLAGSPSYVEIMGVDKSGHAEPSNVASSSTAVTVTGKRFNFLGRRKEYDLESQPLTQGM